MATIRKIHRKTGPVYKAIIKDRPGKAITSKIFTRKTDASIRAKGLKPREAVGRL